MTAQEEKLSRELTEHIVKTYTWLLQCISYHFDNADEYKLKELPKDFNQYLGRIRLAVDAYVTGNTINDELEAYENGELSNQIPIRIKE